MQWCCLPHLYLSRLSDDGECFEINCWYGAALGTTACVSTSGSYKINSLYCVEFWSHFHFASSNPGLWWWWGVAPVADEDVIWLSGEVVTTVVLLVFSELYIFTSIDHYWSLGASSVQAPTADHFPWEQCQYWKCAAGDSDNSEISGLTAQTIHSIHTCGWLTYELLPTGGWLWWSKWTINKLVIITRRLMIS